jgi:hypothetical protein
VQALDTSSQGGSSCSFLLRILRLWQSVLKIPLIENSCSVEVRAVIRFLNAKQISPTEIHKEVYGENVISRKQVLCGVISLKKGGRRCLMRNAQEDQQLRAMLSMNIELNNFCNAGKTRESVEKMGWEILKHPLTALTSTCLES